jgi:hypothetical protein
MALLRRGCAGLIISLFFIAVGVVMTVVLGQVVVLDCARPEPAEIICERRSAFAGIRLGDPETIRDVQGAWVQENCGESCTYRVMLATGDEDVPLTSAFTAGERAKVAAAGQVNAFVKSGAPSARISLRPNPLVLLAALIFVVIGLAIPALSLFGR